MKKDLMYSLPVLLVTACSDNAEEPSNSSNIHCVLNPQEEVLQPYYNLLVENPKIIEAMKLCERPASFQTTLWNKIQEAEKTGLPPTAPKPQSYYDLGLDMKTKSLFEVSFQDFNRYQKIEMVIDDAEYDFYFPAREKDGQRRFVITDKVLERATETFLRNQEEREPIKTIYATKEETHEILAAHFADKLWKEVKLVFPWSIIDYNSEQLGELFGTKTWFKTWDEKNDEYSMNLVLDYSPRETWKVINDIVDLENLTKQKTAVIDITKSLRYFRHGAVKLDQEGNIIGGDPQDITTVSGMAEEKIAREGCQSVGAYDVKLANILNIPGEHVNGYFNGEGHRSVVISFTGHVLAHGDDVYAAYQTNTPSSDLMASLAYWEENVFAYKKGEEPGVHNSWVHSVNSMMTFPAWRLLRDYCEDGKESLTERFKDFASEEEIDELEERIVDITKGCMDFPENNPDNKYRK